jgi:hypothetical protein
MHPLTRVAAMLVLSAAIHAAGQPTGQVPLRLHPDSGRYLQCRGKPTILMTSGEHYGAVLNLDFDYRAYLDELRENGLNLTRAFSGTYREVASSALKCGVVSPMKGRQKMFPTFSCFLPRLSPGFLSP